jgi:HK97 gp10 family phage protein
MATARVRIEGLQALQQRMRALSDDMQGKIAFGAVLAGANVIKKRAISLAPVGDTAHEIDGVRIEPGNLKKNIVAKRVPKGQRQLAAEYVVAVRGKAKNKFASRYGSIQEFGSVKQSPQPFMRPAFDSEKAGAAAKIVEILAKRIAKAEAGQ